MTTPKIPPRPWYVGEGWEQGDPGIYIASEAGGVVYAPGDARDDDEVWLSKEAAEHIVRLVNAQPEIEIALALAESLRAGGDPAAADEGYGYRRERDFWAAKCTRLEQETLGRLKRDDEIAAALEVLAVTMINDSRDWSLSPRDARLYGIVVGWSGDAMREVAARHGWSESAVHQIEMHRASLAKVRP